MTGHTPRRSLCEKHRVKHALKCLQSTAPADVVHICAVQVAHNNTAVFLQIILARDEEQRKDVVCKCSYVEDVLGLLRVEVVCTELQVLG